VVIEEALVVEEVDLAVTEAVEDQILEEKTEVQLP
jgi:hypothetical protein